MIELIPYILILLAISAVAMIFIIRVILKQITLFRYPITDKTVRHFRNTLFAISLVIIIMGLIPIAINVATLFVETGKPSTVKPVSLVYSLAVHLQTLLLSYLLWRIYRLASENFNDQEKQCIITSIKQSFAQRTVVPNNLYRKLNHE